MTINATSDETWSPHVDAAGVGFAGSISWYLNRLRAMSPREVGHRLRELAIRTSSRRQAFAWSDFAGGDWSLPSLPILGERLDAAARAEPALAARIAAEAGALLSGRVTLLGQAWPPGTLKDLKTAAPFLFHRDPVSGRCWPKAAAFCFDVPYRRLPGFGDVKYLWELNRLQFLQTAASHARLAQDPALSAAVFAVFDSWMEQNPPFKGPNWSSGIELALRIVTLVVVVSFIGSPSDPGLQSRLRAFLAAHVFWLARYPSLHSSANNHRIAEGLGLFLAGTLVPALSGAAAHARAGRDIIESECLRQILADGVGAEQSPTYTAFSVEMITFAALVARQADRPLSQTVDDRLLAAVEHFAWLMNANGIVPTIGDKDDGRVIATSIDADACYVRSVAAAVSGFFGGTFPCPAQGLPEIREALFGAQGPPRRTREGIRTFPDGGYTVIRETIDGRPIVLVFDHGPLGYLSIAAHGHADALAVWLDVDGSPVFCDAGSWLYHAGGAVRDALRMSGAHNTVLLDYLSQSMPAGAFNWSSKARARLVAAEPGTAWQIEAAHDGYVRPLGVTHHRRIRRDGADIELGDWLVGTGAPRPASIRFLLAPDINAVTTGATTSLRREDGLLVTMIGPAGFKANLIPASSVLPTGWVSPRFGQIVPSTLLAFEGLMSSTPAVTRLQIGFRARDGN